MLSVRRAFELLSDHPLLGRPAEDGRRELVLSRGRYGYVAEYRWVPAEDVVLIWRFDISSKLDTSKNSVSSVNYIPSTVRKEQSGPFR
jgi:hypothetical protein